MNEPAWQVYSEKVTGNMAIEITVNGEARLMQEGATLLILLEELGLNPKVVAAQVNDTIVPREAHATAILQTGDAVELIRFVGGG
jgi:thiamine biosynthesis protein ThiS